MDVKEFFEEKAEHYPMLDEYPPDVFGFVPVGAKVLDVGCGSGRLLKELVKRNDVVGVDLSFKMLERAKAYTDRLICADAHRLPFKNETFDVAVMSFLWHHLQNQYVAAREVKRVLKKGGTLLVITLSHEDIENSLFSAYSEKYMQKDKERMPDLPDIQAVLEEVGFANFSYIGKCKQVREKTDKIVERIEKKIFTTFMFLDEAEIERIKTALKKDFPEEVFYLWTYSILIAEKV